MLLLLAVLCYSKDGEKKRWRGPLSPSPHNGYSSPKTSHMQRIAWESVPGSNDRKENPGILCPQYYNDYRSGLQCTKIQPTDFKLLEEFFLPCSAFTAWAMDEVA